MVQDQFSNATIKHFKIKRVRSEINSGQWFPNRTNRMLMVFLLAKLHAMSHDVCHLCLFRSHLFQIKPQSMIVHCK